jgi:hypothetical protein
MLPSNEITADVQNQHRDWASLGARIIRTAMVATTCDLCRRGQDDQPLIQQETNSEIGQAE